MNNSFRCRGYVYDDESGLYYLQSRYYDPELGRFINADAFTSTGQGVLGNNMFAYCLNNPVGYIDTTGSAAEDATEPEENDEESNPLRWVGFGIQGELDYGTYSVGIEIIIYWDVEECTEDTWVIALYLYDGRSVDMSDPLLGSVLANLANNIHLLQEGSDESLDSLIKIVQNGGSCSLSGVSLWGTEEFNSVYSYEGPFTSIYGNIGHVKGSFAYSSNCIAASLGRSWGINSRAWGFSRTNYNLLGYMSIPSPVALLAD